MLETYLGLFLGPVIAFIAVLVLMPLARNLAIKGGFVDEPGGRKMHEEPVPPIGGLVLFPVYILAAILTGVDFMSFWPLFMALCLILLMGGLDDYRYINPWLKFILQFVAAIIIVIAGHAQVHELGNFFGFGDVGLGLMAIPFSVFTTVLLINAINLMDGLDGLAAGKSFVALFWLVLACVLAERWEAASHVMLLMGAVLGFLFYNMRHPFRDRACVFLGDAGSMGLGLVLAWFAIHLAQKPAPVLEPISVAWILALPVMDACGQFFRRMREGRHPFSPDRGHFHHHFIHAGLPVGHSTAVILFLGFVLGGIGYGGIMAGVPEWFLVVGWVILLISHMVLSLRPDGYVKFFKRLVPGEKMDEKKR